MNSSRPEKSVVSDATQTSRIAALILEDIRQRGSKPGDRYLNGPEIAQKYGVSLIMANRALQSLARRKVLERWRRAGTFIGTDYRPPEASAGIRCVHLVMPAAYFRLSRTSVEQALFGLHSVLPETNIQYTFLPPAGELPFVRQLAEQAAVHGGMEGVVLYVAPAEVQQFFRESGIPTVVFGSVHPEAGGLPWVDRDQHQIGQVLAEFLVSEGHLRAAVLMREQWGYGDNLFMDGIQAAGTSLSLRVRSLAALPEVAAGVLKSVLKAKDAPTALICRTEKLAAVAALAAADLRLKIPKDLRLVVADNSPQYPCVQPTISQEEQGRMIGQMLQQLGNGHRPDPDHLLVPVRLFNPLAS